MKKNYKGKYEIFKVGEELVCSDSREKIIEYAKNNGIESITYRMSADNINNMDKDIKKV